MKLSIGNCLFIVFVLSISSCNSKSNFEYDNDKGEYQEALNCLHQNYFTIFSDSASKDANALALFARDISNLRLCGSITQLMDKHSIEYVYYYRDSTIAFYQNPKNLIRGKQFILIFANDEQKIINKLASDVKIIEKHNGCYELEKIISLAN